jgi:hypothetical protein
VQPAGFPRHALIEPINPNNPYPDDPGTATADGDGGGIGDTAPLYAMPPTGLLTFQLGTVPASVTPPRSWRGAAWFAGAAALTAAAGIAFATSLICPFDGARTTYAMPAPSHHPSITQPPVGQDKTRPRPAETAPARGAWTPPADTRPDPLVVPRLVPRRTSAAHAPRWPADATHAPTKSDLEPEPTSRPDAGPLAENPDTAPALAEIQYGPLAPIVPIPEEPTPAWVADQIESLSPLVPETPVTRLVAGDPITVRAVTAVADRGVPLPLAPDGLLAGTVPHGRHGGNPATKDQLWEWCRSHKLT